MSETLLIVRGSAAEGHIIQERIRKCYEQIDGSRGAHQSLKSVMNQIARRDDNNKPEYNLDYIQNKSALHFNHRMMDSIQSNGLVGLIKCLKMAKAGVTDKLSEKELTAYDDILLKHFAAGLATVFHELYRAQIFVDELTLDHVGSYVTRDIAVRIRTKRGDGLDILVTSKYVRIGENPKITFVQDDFEKDFRRSLTVTPFDLDEVGEVLLDNIVRSMLDFSYKHHNKTGCYCLPSEGSEAAPCFTPEMTWKEINLRYGITRIANAYGLMHGGRLCHKELKVATTRFKQNSRNLPRFKSIAEDCARESKNTKPRKVKKAKKTAPFDVDNKLMEGLLLWAYNNHHKTGIWCWPLSRCVDIVPGLTITWNTVLRATSCSSSIFYGHTIRGVKIKFGFSGKSADDELQIAAASERFVNTGMLPPKVS